MWGTQAVGKLVAGADPLKPQIDAFVDEVAGDDVAQKVQRRLQHFIDRKVATLFEPLHAIANDETLTGLARGFAFQLVEGLGLLRRDAVMNDVKALDQDARGALRKHGVRFGQFTIFMPLLLKPAPTRLRLVLWALANGLQDFPESPPPGVVTVPVAEGAPDGHDLMSGYRVAGARMIRVDMLERLADQIRAEDTRGGFEAKADMLSITGMTLEQFADLMQGLGYKAERSERIKERAVSTTDTAEDAPEKASGETLETPAEGDAPSDDASPVEAEKPAEIEKPAADAVEPELEVVYSFSWAPKRKPPAQNNRPAHKKGPKKGKKGGKQPVQKRDFSARPPKKEKAIDPDNPFAAALMGLKDKI